MIPNEDPTESNWWRLAKSLPNYSLSDFGKTEYIDPVVPVQILLVMMGFTVTLLNGIDLFSAAGQVRSCGILCGVSYLILYMFYLTEYYEKLWEKYFLLPEDKLFFRAYSLLVGVVVISLMSKWPEYWSAYVLGLFLIMFYKKTRTREIFREAVVKKYGSYKKCTDGKIKAQYVLVDTFTWNFLYLGIYVLLPFAVVMCVSAAYVEHKEVMEFINQFAKTEFSVETMRNVYYAVNLFVTGGTIVFWSAKVTSGLRQMRDQIEEGHYAYFEERDLRVRLRRGRYAG